MARSVIVYKTGRNGEVIKLHGAATPRESYDASADRPYHERILGAYRQCEEEGKLNRMGPREKSYIRSVHERALSSGQR